MTMPHEADHEPQVDFSEDHAIPNEKSGVRVDPNAPLVREQIPFCGSNLSLSNADSLAANPALLQGRRSSHAYLHRRSERQRTLHNPSIAIQ